MADPHWPAATNASVNLGHVADCARVAAMVALPGPEGGGVEESGEDSETCYSERNRDGASGYWVCYV